MRFVNSKPISGSLECGFIDGWIWPRPSADPRPQGGYPSGQDFFFVHWGVQRRDPNSVRLYIGSPRHAVDPFLNDLKQAMINAILGSELAEAVVRGGYMYQVGKRLSSAAKGKTTELFRVVLTDDQRSSTAEEDILMVHGAIGDLVDGGIQRFAVKLNQRFVAWS